MRESIPLSLHVIGSRGSGGAERFFSRLVSAFRAADLPVAALIPRGSAVSRGLAPAVAQHHLSMRGNWDLLARRGIAGAVREIGPEIVQTYMGRATRLTRLAAGRRPVHVARLGGYYDLKGYRHAHAWVGNTQGICDYLVRKGLPPERVFSIGNFVEPARDYPPATLALARAEAAVPDDGIAVFSAGRLHPNKGFADLLDAIARLPRTVQDRPLTWLIAGDGPLRERLRRRARDLDIDARIRWLGWVDDPAPYYALADLFVSPSRHEPLGNVILEAWRHRVPVVATRTAGAAELITDGENGRLVPREDPEALATTVLDLLRQPKTVRAALGDAGQVALDTRFSRAAILCAYGDMYRTLVGSTP